MRTFKVFSVFLILNFGALSIGNLLMNNGVQTDWYLDFTLAAWSPPGWSFGMASTFIMFCFSIYMTELYRSSNTKEIKWLFALQLVLIIGWIFIFFNQRSIAYGFVALTLLTLVIFYFLISNQPKLRFKRLLILPYFSWLCVVTWLSLDIVLNN
tara:strand:- start:67086 stop:67547 length:462 start_codon:yes stop_codon:yes gene_type:complete